MAATWMYEKSLAQGMPHMGRYKLIYFNAKGRAEPIRLAFEVAGVPYEDKRVEKSDWQSLKSCTPLGQLPVLEANGTMIAETVVILSFVGRELGLAGQSRTDAARVDMIVMSLHNLLGEFLKEIYAEGGGDIDTFKAQKLATVFGSLEKMACGSCFVGKSMTIADIMLFDIVEKICHKISGCCGGYPKLASIVENVGCNDSVASWLERRPKTDF